MTIVYLLVILAVLVVAGAIGAWVWAARRGQFDDLDTPAIRMLHDDTPPARPPSPPAGSND